MHTGTDKYAQWLKKAKNVIRFVIFDLTIAFECE